MMAEIFSSRRGREMTKMLMKTYRPAKTRWKDTRVNFIDGGTLNSSKQKLI